MESLSFPPKVPDDSLMDESGGWCLHMKATTPTTMNDNELLQQVNEMSLLEPLEIKEESNEFDWSFRSINHDNNGEEEHKDDVCMKRDHPGTPCSPALLQKTFSWGYLNLGAKKKRHGSFSQSPSLTIAGAPQLPTEEEICPVLASSAGGREMWRPTPCFSPLAGRTTLARFIPNIIESLKEQRTSPSPNSASNSATNDESAKPAFPLVPSFAQPPVLPASPDFQARSTSVPLRMRNKGEGNAVLLL